MLPGDLIDKCRLDLDTYENFFQINHAFEKIYLKERCLLINDQHFFLIVFGED